VHPVKEMCFAPQSKMQAVRSRTRTADADAARKTYGYPTSRISAKYCFVPCSPFLRHLTPAGKQSGSAMAVPRGLAESRFTPGRRARRYPGQFPLTGKGIALSRRTDYSTFNTPTMVVDPWSVSPAVLDVAAGQLFAASLLPYLAFLFYISKEETNIPSQALFGFRFLLVFVFVTIPAGVYAKVHYHDILANIDWLHGSAESFLTITNLFIALGFRNALTRFPGRAREIRADPVRPSTGTLKTPLIATASAVGLYASATIIGAIHAEPSNALSFPTWIIHVSSLIEWLVAMGLVWQYAETTGNEKWKGLTWGMLPLHSSGICACTYHLFYNAPSLNFLVTLQAALTCLGNTTMAFAAYRIFKQVQASAGAVETTGDAEFGTQDNDLSGTQSRWNADLVGFEDLGAVLRKDSNTGFIVKLLLLSAVGSAAVKWGSLVVDGIFYPDPRAALAVICIPSVLNIFKWTARSRDLGSNSGDLL
jgi:Protein of unknown function (DUF2499)/Protein of unknown function (DUF3593)